MSIVFLLLFLDAYISCVLLSVYYSYEIIILKIISSKCSTTKRINSDKHLIFHVCKQFHMFLPYGPRLVLATPTDYDVLLLSNILFWLRMCSQKLGNYLRYTFYSVTFFSGVHLWWNLRGVRAGDVPWSAYVPEMFHSEENFLRGHKKIWPSSGNIDFIWIKATLQKTWTAVFKKFV